MTTPTKRSFFHVEMSRGTIRFPSRVRCSSFEEVITEAYRKSHQKKYTAVCFDFSNVVWCDLFPLTLTANWILSLRKQDKAVEFQFPNDEDVHRFITSYRFERFLAEHNVSFLDIGSKRIREKPNNLLRVPFFPLTMLSDASFKALLQDLYHGERLSTVFAGLEETEVVKSGAIRDVILFELGDNIYLHAGGEGAHLSMTKFSRQFTTGAHPIDSIDKDFFTKIQGHDVLEIAIEDNGPGLYETLSQSYLADDTLPNRLPSPTDCDLIEYALLYHSSRRTVAERLGRIRDIIKSEDLTFPPPTGLFRLKECVRQLRGLLYIRSGAGIVAYDFLSNPNSTEPTKSDNFPRQYRPCRMAGVQYRIVLPTVKPQSLPGRLPFSNRTTATSYIGKYEYLAVADYFRKDNPGDLDSAAEALDNIFKTLNSIHAQSNKAHIVVVADFHGCEQVSSKALHYLFYELMQRQGQLQTNIVLNCFLTLEIAYLKTIHHGSCLPMQVYDSSGRFHVFGLTQDQNRVVQDLLRTDTGQLEGKLQLAEDLPHIFAFDPLRNGYVLRVDYSQAIRISKEAIRRKLMSTILEQIFDPDIRVLLPSQRYCTGYFETYRIYQEPHLFSQLKRYLLCSLTDTPFDLIISIGKEVGVWVDSVLANPIFTNSSRKGHINLPTENKGSVSIAPILGINKGTRVVIITDVLGTCKTVLGLMKNLTQTEVIKIISIVNAAVDSNTTLEVSGRPCNIESIVTKSLRYYYDLPAEWSYTEVHQVDQQTHLLARNISKVKGPLFKGINYSDKAGVPVPVNEFFTDIVAPANGIREGHFFSKSSHIVYLFDIPKINAIFNDDIATTIVNDIKEVEGVLTEDRRDPVSHVVFPHYNPGMDILAKRVAKDFPGSAVVKVSERELQPSLDQDTSSHGISKAVVIDDATITGETVFRMIDICERMGARFIYVYIIIKRSTSYIARRLEKTRQYGRSHLHIRYLMDTELPSYPADQCPICKDNRELQSLQTTFSSNPMLNGYFEQRLKDQQMQPVEVALDDSPLPSPSSIRMADLLSLTYRWLIECAKTNPAARHALAETVRDHNANPSEVLILFSVLHREWIPRSLPAKLREDLFYPSFANDIVKASRFFLSQLSALSIGQLRSVLYLSEEFDPFFVGENLQEMLLQCQGSILSLTELAVQIIRSKAFRDHLAIVSAAFSELKATHGNRADVVVIADSLLEYCDASQKKDMEHKASRLSAYEELRGGVFHEIQHLRTSLEYSMSKSGLIEAEVLRDWDTFRIEIDKIIALLRKAIGFKEKTPLCNKLESLVSKVNFKTYEIDRLLRGLKKSDQFPRPHVKEMSLQVTNMIFGKDGIRELLNLFETNVKSVSWAIIQQHESSLTARGISVERLFPDELCMVYGEEGHYKLIMHNLIENAWKWSNGSRLVISAETIPAETCLIIRVLDDGTGLPKDLAKGHGLRNVEALVNRYYGEFDFSASPPDQFRDKGFKTSMTLRLPFFLPSKEEAL